MPRDCNQHVALANLLAPGGGPHLQQRALPLAAGREESGRLVGAQRPVQLPHAAGQALPEHEAGGGRGAAGLTRG